MLVLKFYENAAKQKKYSKYKENVCVSEKQRAWKLLRTKTLKFARLGVTTWRTATY